MKPHHLHNPFIERLTERSDVIIAVAVVGILILMIFPIPTPLLDVLLAFGIAVALLVLLMAMYATEPLEFSVFPGLLLVLTLLRLGLNVASTRLILADGFAGHVIEAFGGFVVKGNYVVGLIIFLILVVINFVVITKGSGRIAEVAARFTLDAMPGKQMAIDADLNNGIIDEKEARERRDKIAREADFYGAMDGAAKFVRGDAVAGLLITLVNIVGGLIIGVVQKGMPLIEAVQKYTLLTIGDGLVTQVPALIVSTAAGVLVSRAASESNLGRDITGQLLSQPRAIAIASGVLGFFALMPGLPTVPFLILAGSTGYLAVMTKRGALLAERHAAEAPKTSRPEEKITDFLHVDPLELEIGYGLIPLVDKEQDGDLVNRIGVIRKQQALETGIVIPPIRIRDNLQLKASDYLLKVRGNEVARGELRVGNLLALNPGGAAGKVKGIATREPTFGLPALWIAEAERESAENYGWTVVEPAAVLATHIVEILKRNAHKILSREEAKKLLDNLKATSPSVVEELIPNLLTLGTVHKILQKLLKEGVPIRDLAIILETLSDWAPHTKDADLLTEYVRYALAPTITERFSDEDGKIYAITLDPTLESQIAEELQRSQNRGLGGLALSPMLINSIYRQLIRLTEEMTSQGRRPIVVCSPTVRAAFHRLLEPVMPHVAVISYGELLVNTPVESTGMVSPE
ncbi:MAG: flagellar biosynthesis protein FlhA [Calditrichaeota bacterium]|nr:flagellar biosynthesis protein FlhA [Calditrichota bacterium]